MNLNHR